MRKIVLSVFAILMLCLGAEAQVLKVSGTVADQNGQPVIGATVAVAGTTEATITDTSGVYQIQASADATLEVSYVGMKTNLVEVNGRTLVNVTLQPSTTQIEDVVVVAYGTAKKDSFTGSAAVVSDKELKTRKVANVSKALDGLAPGIQTTSGSGQPGSGSTIVIRGIGSLSAGSTPLYVVDGVPYGGSVNAINPEDIENITILKDAAASVLYGSRGANGVVMITTKKGSDKGTDINFKASYGVSSRAFENYETMGTKDFMETMYWAYRQQAISGGTPIDQAGLKGLYEMSQGRARIFGSNERYNPYNYNVWVADDEDNPVVEQMLINPATGKIREDATLYWDEKWIDEVTNNAAPRQEYMLSFNGGNAKNQYMFSAGYLNEDGTLITTNFERITGRLNVDTQARPWLHAGMGANFSRSTSNSMGATDSSTSNVWYSAFLMGPIYPVYIRDREQEGAFVLDENGNKRFDYGKNERPSGQQNNFNSIATLYDDMYKATTDNMSIRGHVDLLGKPGSWLDGLKLQVNLGADYYNSNSTQAYNTLHGNAADQKGRLTKGNIGSLNYTLNQLLSYNKTIGQAHIDLLVGHEYYDYEEWALEAQKTGFPMDGLYELSAGTVITAATSASTNYRMESYLARMNFDWADKYYLSASWRTDGSSRFYKDNRWGQFWSVGGNWRVSQEEFMQNAEGINNLSLKASYGIQGNDTLSSFYPWQATYSLAWSNASEFGGLVGSIENKGISWEENKNLNIGMEARLWDRVNLSVEWYKRLTDGMLLVYPLPWSSGYSGYYRNAGNMQNVGIELTLGVDIVNTEKFQWTSTLMASHNENKVLKLVEVDKANGEKNDQISGDQIIREGEPVYSYYVPKSAGVDPRTGDQLYWAYETFADLDEIEAFNTKNGTTFDGHMIGEKVPGSDYITNQQADAQASKVVCGDRTPDVYGSWNNYFRLGNFDLSVQTNFSFGGVMTDDVYSGLKDFYYPAQAKHVDLLRAWKQPGDVTDIRRIDIGEYGITTSDDLVDASYVAIKNITLGYTLPQSIVSRLGIKGLRAAVSADNLAMFSQIQGMDPQYSISGGTNYVYAPTRTISFSLDFSF